MQPMKTFTAPDGTVYEVCDEVARSKTAVVTAASIKSALGYTPMPMSESVTSGQFAISDGAGGITWLALTNVSEVGA